MAKQNWENYELQKNKVKSLVATKILKIHTKHEQALQESDNKSRCFWRYVRSLQPHEDLEHKTIGSGEDQWTTEEEITEGMTKYFQGLQASLYKRPRTQEETSLRPQEQFDRSIPEPIAPGELQRHINKLEAGKAIGPDDIPNEFLKKLKPVAQKHLRYLLNNMLAKSTIPEAWKQAKIKLIYKGKDKDKKSLHSYRPITILSNVYKLFASILQDRLQRLCEKARLFSEAQNGFRRNRRGSDNLFTVTQLIELKNLDRSPLYLAYLDLEKAYDAVPHEKMWTKLEAMALDVQTVSLFRNMYAGCNARYSLGEHLSGQVNMIVGLRQGCPLSPTLFNIYINNLILELQAKGQGVSFTTITSSNDMETTYIPVLAFADDILLLSENETHLQDMLDICTRIGNEEGFKFSKEKSKWMGYNVHELKHTFRVQEVEVEHTKEYRYLGVTLQEGPLCLELHERNTLKTSNIRKGHLWNMAKYSYNPYTLARALWKSVAVPAITYANDAVVFQQTTLKTLDRHQVEIGRWALGGNGATANLAVTGEMAWSAFKQRGARAKLGYLGRLIHMPDEAYAKRTFHYVRYRSSRTNWSNTIARLDSVYSKGTRRHEATSEKGWLKAVTEEVNAIELEAWRQAVRKKQSLQSIYALHKPEPSPCTHYRGDHESALLFQARVGALMTGCRRAQLFGDTDTACHLCGQSSEDYLHVLLWCPALDHCRPPWATSEERIPEMLGFGEGAHGSLATRRFLVEWERLRLIANQ
ncbi:uncharacterized protein LOC115331529 [Ixodes scapularis]|uniref:uncharacterized protein LOC115331529 n=1 Tax=Ixodes scapularis TaxID=6945 RepID=UPI001A9EDCB2|nr:uncharacterized protein LOC115331529 [Ixodes scapularis]